MNKEWKIICAAQRFRTKLEQNLYRVSTRQKPTRKYEWLNLMDIADYFKLCDYIENRKFLKAAKFMFDLDTASRDEVPAIIYDYLNEMTQSVAVYDRN